MALTRCSSCNMHFMVRQGEVGGALCPKCVSAQTADVAPITKMAPQNTAPKKSPPANDQRAKLANAMRAKNARRERERSNDGFATERKAISMGVVGGILLMVAAVVWFFVGLAVGIIFFYPPVLFCIGIFAVVAGIYDSVTGKGKSRRRK